MGSHARPFICLVQRTAMLAVAAGVVMKLLTLPAQTNKKDALEVLESLKKAIEDGEIIAFGCVGISEDDNTSLWSSSVKPVSRLRMIGAMNHMLHSYEDGC